MKEVEFSLDEKTNVRLAPYIASRSCLSRRQAEVALLEGRVTIFGKVVRDFYAEDVEGLALDGALLQGQSPQGKLWIYHKPRGQLVTHKDPQNRPTVVQALLPLLPSGRIVYVGRLDYETEGLLLMTNKPSWAHYLETSRLRRVYHVTVNQALSSRHLAQLAQGMVVDGIFYRPAFGKFLTTSFGERGKKLSLTLDEGKKREVRLLMGALGAKVTHLKRVSFGPFQLGNLPLGALRPVSGQILTQLGLQEKEGKP